MVWTDGYCYYPMSDNSLSLSWCPSCKDVYRICDAKQVGILSTTDFVDESLEVPQEMWKKSVPIQEPSDIEIYSSLEKSLFKNEKEIRIIAWWKSNDKFRHLCENESNKEVIFDAEREANLVNILNIMTDEEPSESLMKAEIFRQLRRFTESMDAASLINDCGSIRMKAERINYLASKYDYIVRHFD